ncbi:MAG: cytochrome d ubiquinol oxidase subunit II [Bacteroidales bacterium]|nr:cytochrome d ubiquinol oxidase subunit II [Bacteroidales bacterium]
MFEQLSYLALQQYWWFIISVLGGILVFLLFVQGGQSLLYVLGKTKEEVTVLVNVFGHKWDLTFTTLVTFGGALFASFPLVYSTYFGGGYWLWMLVLSTFILQAVSYEFRTKAGNFLGQKTYEWFLFLNGLVGTISLGVAVATFFTGGNFVHNEMNFVSWANAWHGLEAFANPINLALGLAVFFLSRVLAMLYVANRVLDESILERVRKRLRICAPLFLFFFLTFIVSIWLSKGYGYLPSGEVIVVKHKYLLNFIEMPLVGIIFLLGVLLVLWGLIRSLFFFANCYKKAIWFVGLGTFLTVLSLFFNLGYNNTVIFPSLVNIQHSLTIENSSSSQFTLTVMSYVSLLVPFVVGYIVYAWYSMNRKKASVKDLESSEVEPY